MNDAVTPLVAATVARHAAQARLDLERLRAARESTETVSRGGQSRALALGKRIRHLVREADAWDAVAAFTAPGEAPDDEAETPDDEAETARCADHATWLEGWTASFRRPVGTDEARRACSYPVGRGEQCGKVVGS